MLKETRKYVNVDFSPERIYIAIDPDGGGRSRLSVISGFICRGEKMKDQLPGTLIITGIDFKQCNSELEQDDVVAEHIRKIRKNPLFKNTLLILIPENQTGFTHTRIERNFTGYQNVVTLHENMEEKPGVRKDPHKTKEYVICVNDKLKGGLIAFSKHWISSTKSDIGQDEGVGNKNQSNSIGHHRKEEKNANKEWVISELTGEMIRYCYDEHGKLTGKINGGNDDLYVAFAMLCYFSIVVEYVPIYSPYRISVF